MFLRYFEGATPKRKLHKQTNDKNSKKNYEKDRKHKFQSSWVVNRPWLMYNEDEGILTCSVCKTKFKVRR
jgi:hypothetical protein